MTSPNHEAQELINEAEGLLDAAVGAKTMTQTRATERQMIRRLVDALAAAVAGREELAKQIEALRELSEKATPGPWGWREKHGRDQTGEGWSQITVYRDNRSQITEIADLGQSEQDDPQADAALIVAAVNLVRSLVAASPVTP